MSTPKRNPKGWKQTEAVARDASAPLSMSQATMEEVLNQIQERLSHQEFAADIIADLLPKNIAEALPWARRLPGWDEYQGRYSKQTLALARVVSRRGMRLFGLSFRDDGRVMERCQSQKPLEPKPAAKFLLEIGEETIVVEYTPDSVPRGGVDHFAFKSRKESPQPHALSQTGYLSKFVNSDAVAACGGHEEYAALFAQARMRGEEKEFDASLEGDQAEGKRARPAGKSALGTHALKVIEQEEARGAVPSAEQRQLFE
jgi:hypothetical protein